MSLTASHLLLKTTASRNPVSRRTNQPITQTPEEAAAEMQVILQTLTPANFAEKAQARSDCGSFSAGGDLGTFGSGDMMKPFEDATRATAVGSISPPVTTDSGLHVILRVA